MTTRADLLAYLAAAPEVHLLATDVGQAETDTAGGYGPALDDAFATLGLDPADSAAVDLAPAQSVPARALARYYALVQLQGQLALRIDTTLDNGGMQRQESQQFKAVAALVAEAAQRCKAAGVPVGPNAQRPIAVGRFDLDYLARPLTQPRRLTGW